MDIYERQKDLPLKIPKSVAVIGAGGVGSWVALFFALLGTKKIIIIDDDNIEEHNLNRTPFTTLDVGSLKVDALANLINERRLDCEVITISKRIEHIRDEEVRDEVKNVEIIIDCRDVMQPLPFKHNRVIALRYDGEEVWMCINPDYEKYWGEEGGYRTVPSFIAPPVFLAIMSLIIVALKEDLLNEKEKEVGFKLSDFVEKLFS